MPQEAMFDDYKRSWCDKDIRYQESKKKEYNMTKHDCKIIKRRRINDISFGLKLCVRKNRFVSIPDTNDFTV